MADKNNNIKTPNNVGGMFGYNFYNSNIANNEKLTLEQKQKKIDFNNNIGQIAMMAQGLGSLIEGYAASRQDTTPLEQRVGLYDLGGQLMGGMQVGMGALQLGANAFNQSKIANTKQLKEQIRDFGTKQSTAMSFDDLAKEYDQYSALKHISARDLRGNSYLQDVANAVSSGASGAMTGSIFGPAGAILGGIAGIGSSVVGSIIGRNKAKKEATELSKSSDWASTSRQSILGYRGGEISKSNFLNMMRNYGTEDEGVNVQAYGGPMFTQGGIWDNNLTYINNGGTHEQNPIEGVPMGVAPDGTPNLVEEGEIIWNDYVFSNRLKLPKRLLDKYKLGGKLTFAEAVDALTKQSKEMPNDPITKATNDVILSELQNEQELVRMNRQKNKLKRRMSNLASIQELDNMQNVFPTSDINAFGGRLYGGEEEHSSQMVKVPFNHYGYVPGYDLGWFGDDGEYKPEYLAYVDSITTDQANKMLDEQNYFFHNATEAERQSDRYKAIQKFYKENPTFDRQHINLTPEQLTFVKDGMRDGKPGALHNVAFQNMSMTPFNPVSDDAVRSWIEDVNKDFNLSTPEKIVDDNWLFPKDSIEKVADTTTNDDNKNEKTTPMPMFDSNLKYAPIGINALSTLYNIASPIDYSEANAYSSIAGNVKPNYISFSPIQNTLRYRPVDPTIGLNQAAASNAANKRTLSELAINPLTARAGILANEYAYQLGIGEIMRKAQEENWNRRKEVAQEQRTVDAFNSDGRRQVATQNQAEDAAVRALQTNYTTQAAKARAAAKQAKATAIGSGLTTLANNFYNLGVQRDNSGALQWLLNNGYLS